MSISSTPKPLQERWSSQAFQEMSMLWNLSLEDQQKMRQLEVRLRDIGHWKNDPFEVVRYYLDFKGNLKKAEKKFRSMVQWRIDRQVDTFLERYGEPDPLWHQFPIQVLDAVDKDGDAIYLDRCGVCDSHSFLQHFGMDAMQDYLLFIRELTERRDFWRSYEKKMGHRFRYFTVIMDLDGLNVGHMRPGLLPLLNRVARIAQDYYAGMGKRFILLRAPAIFKVIWSIARHFFDPHIQDLILITSHKDYLEVVQQYIELENLPACIVPGYGKARPMPGYFEKVSLKGGSLTKDIFVDYEEEEEEDSDEIKKESNSCRSTASSSSTSTDCTFLCTSTKLLLKGMWDKEGKVELDSFL